MWEDSSDSGPVWDVEWPPPPLSHHYEKMAHLRENSHPRFGGFLAKIQVYTTWNVLTKYDSEWNNKCNNVTCEITEVLHYKIITH